MINLRKLNIFLSYLMMAFLAIPIFKAPFWGTSYALVMAVIIGLWLATSIRLDFKALCSNTLQLQVWLLIVFYIGCAALGLGTIKSVLISVATPWCPMIIFLFYINKRDYSGLRTIVKWAFITFAVTMVTTLYGLITNTYLSRVFGTLDVSAKRLYMYQNVGDIGYIYAAGLLFILMLSLLFTAKKCFTEKARVALILVALVSIALVILGSSGITLISVVISAICIMLYAVNNQRVRIVLIIFVVVTGFIFFVSGALRNFFVQLSKESSNVYLNAKFASIADTLGTGSASGDLRARFDLYINDWSVFISSFGFGIGPFYGGTGNITSVFIAEHSQFFADLARYGVVFLVYILILLKSFFTIMKRLACDCGIRYRIIPVLICYILMYCLQPIMLQQSMGYFVFFIWPGMPLILSKMNATQKR